MLHILVTISKKFCCRKDIWGYAKVIHKKNKKKRRVEKKKEMNKIAQEMS
jgi:hypothetical protein